MTNKNKLIYKDNINSNKNDKSQILFNRVNGKSFTKRR